MIRAISLSFGYVENATMGHVVFVHNVGFKTGEEAVKHLAGRLYEVFKKEDEYHNSWEIKLRETCKSHGKAYKEYPLAARTETREAFQNALSEMMEWTCDDAGDLHDMEEWWPWYGMEELLTIPADQWVFFFESAEVFLADSIKENWSDDKGNRVP